MCHKRDKARLASKKALAGEAKRLFGYARQWWAISALLWDRVGDRKNVLMSKSRERYCSTMIVDDEDEDDLA